MTTKSRESIYGSSVRHSGSARPRLGDRLARVAWNQRMLGFGTFVDGAGGRRILTPGVVKRCRTAVDIFEMSGLRGGTEAR
jgi:hypothetical protein